MSKEFILFSEFHDFILSDKGFTAYWGSCHECKLIECFEI